MVKKSAVLLVAILTLMLGACSQPQDKKDETKKTPAPKAVDVAQVITDEWEKSGHAKAVGADKPAEAPGMNEGGKCFFCHNGYAFELKAESLKGIGILKGASCDTCHTGYGKELLKNGSVELPIGTVKGGKGTLCSACHMGRGKMPDQKSAPHHSVQTDMLLSKSGAEAGGFTYAQSPHKNSSDTCLSCHMAEDKDGIRGHGFKVTEESSANTCGKCHSFKSLNPEAKADYDGDGNKEGIQTEVSGLLDLLEKAILDKLSGGKFISTHGQIVFQDAQGKDLTAPPSEELYNAAWNYFFVDFDGSKGVHNPGYAVQLLQQSFKAVTGNDVPKAEIRK